MTVTVAMPYFGCPDLVERAVRSALAQTHRDVRVVVIGDGEDPPLAGVRDSRLEVYRLPENRGAYFGFQLILAASPDEWHAPIGADDWYDPEHLERLLALRHPAVGVGTVWFHDARGRRPEIPTVERQTKRGWNVGVFRADRVRSIGGYDPSARLSQDTHVLRLLDLTGGYLRHVGRRPTYHRWKRAGSLTTTPATNLRSPIRIAAREHNWSILQECRRLLPDLAAVRAYRESMVTPAIRDELAEHVARLSARCGTSS